MRPQKMVDPIAESPFITLLYLQNAQSSVILGLNGVYFHICTSPDMGEYGGLQLIHVKPCIFCIIIFFIYKI